MSKRISLSALASALAIWVASPGSARALTINAIYDPSVTGAQQSVINSAISFYQNTFSDPITVNIAFAAEPTCGLGCSNKWVYSSAYSTYRNALGADATSTDDATAMANTPNTATNPVNGGTSINYSSATGRAVGLNTPGATMTCLNTSAVVDGCVRFNPNITTTNPPQNNLYSLLTVVEHEIDEVLGLGSDVGGTGFFASPAAEDLFRYASPGVRSYAPNANCPGSTAYFSIDGGATNLVGFNNCNNGGDYGDWVTSGTHRVQDAFGNPGEAVSLNSSSPEVRALDVIGYTLSSQTTTPEPSTLLLFGTGLGGLLTLGVRRQRKA